MLGQGNTRGRPKGSGINDSDRLAAIARLIDADPDLKPTTAIKALGVSDPSIIRRLRDKYNELHSHGDAPCQSDECASASPARDTPKAKPETIVATSKPVPARAQALAARSQPAARRTAAPATGDKPQKSTTRAGKSAAPAAAGASRSVSATPAKPTNGSAGTAQSSEPDSKPVLQLRAAPALSARPEPMTRDGEATRSLPREADRQRQLAPAGGEITETARQQPRRNDDFMVSFFGFGIAAANSAMAAQVSFAETIVRNSYMSLVLRQQVAFNEWALQLTPWSAVKSLR